MRSPAMAAARDQAARIIRSEPEAIEGDTVRNTSAQPAEQLRGPAAEEAKRRPSETPAAPAPEQPAAPAQAAAAPKPAKRRFVMMGVLGRLALAAAGYGVYWFVAGRFYISTDDAYVRANNSMLGARVSGHLAAILPADNSIVRAGEVIFRIDDGD